MEHSQDRATEYKFSVTSNPGSRRSSFINDDDQNSTETVVDKTTTALISKNDYNIISDLIVPQVRILNDSMMTLDSNLQKLKNINDNLIDFNESFGSLLFGLMCNAWCVDFPKNTFQNTDIDLQKLKILDNLKIEKSNLQNELNSLKNALKFKKPLNRTNLKKHDNNQSHIPFYYNNNLKNDSEDDTNSEASFVMNPTFTTSNENNNKVSSPSINKSLHNKYKRKSFINKVRNSIINETDPLLNTTSNNNNTHSSKASRIISRPTSKELNNNDRRIPVSNQRSTTNIWKKPQTSQSLANRPPFR